MTTKITKITNEEKNFQYNIMMQLLPGNMPCMALWYTPGQNSWVGFFDSSNQPKSSVIDYFGND